MRFLTLIAVFFVLMILSVPCLKAVTGDTVFSIPAPAKHPQGLTFDGTFFWNVDRKTDMVYKVKPDDGTVLDSFPAPGYNPI
ncbi:MAG: hypothetical protein PHU88_10940 [candidate division Zixibacteria bacterium]|nr:hypothetical protein [candidate division Zixibacteria bacterium]